MRVVLGVGGGIAAYKAPEIVRGLYKAGAQVQVTLTRNGERFVTALTLQTLSGSPVLTDAWDPSSDAIVRHVELGRDLDALAVAPCTTNLLGKFAAGIADDFLTTLFTAVRCPVVLAPSMNTRMWLHEATQANVETLRSRGVVVLEPDDGWLAERESGVGRMPEPEAIVARVLDVAARRSSLAGRRVVVTAGPTREAVDPVRFLSNRSSGKMGFAIADALARRGAEVDLVAGPVSLATPYGVTRTDVVTAAEMRDAVVRIAAGADAVFMVAAVSDWVPQAATDKLKKTAGAPSIVFDPAPDILAELGFADRPGQLVIGFAAETAALERHAGDKLKKKNVDFIVANDVSKSDCGMDADDNEVVVFGRDGSRVAIPRASKGRIADAIVEHVLLRASVAAGG